MKKSLNFYRSPWPYLSVLAILVIAIPLLDFAIGQMHIPSVQKQIHAPQKVYAISGEPCESDEPAGHPPEVVCQ